MRLRLKKCSSSGEEEASTSSSAVGWRIITAGQGAVARSVLLSLSKLIYIPFCFITSAVVILHFLVQFQLISVGNSVASASPREAKPPTCTRTELTVK